MALPANWQPRETTLRLNSVADKVLFWGILAATASAGLALWDSKVIWPTSDLSGLEISWPAAPHTLFAWCCCAFPTFEPALLARGWRV